MNEIAKEIRISDLASAAFALAKGHQLIRLERTNGRRCFFVFPEAANADILAFFQGEMVQGRAFADAFRNLKTLTYGR